MSGMPKGLVPARYIGNHAVELGPGKTYYNIDGTRRTSNSLDVGDTLMMQDEDVLGKTLLHDPQGNKPSLSLGIGRNILPEHAGLSRLELGLLGYEFHMGRPDFEPVEPLAPATQPTQETVPVSTTVVASEDVKIEEVPAETVSDEQKESKAHDRRHNANK